MMKKPYRQTLISSVFVLLLSSSCTDTCETIASYTYYRPVTASLEEVRAAVKVESAHEITQSGSIYLINDFLLINEPSVGIHLIDNKDPETPQNMSFINIPGNYNMSAVDGYIYADSYMDLVVIDIRDIYNPKEVSRLENVFDHYNLFSSGISEGEVIVDWVQTKATDDVSSECNGDILSYYDWGYMYDSGIALETSTSSFTPATTTGIGGSMAKFAISKDHLYMIDDSEMTIADISTPNEPTLDKVTTISWDIETIFPFNNMLFIGANNGMYIYDISTPKDPTLMSNYTHVTSCDPVVTDGRYAYVTLRSGNSCQGFTDQLEIIDIEDASQPELLETYPMYNPHGLSISNGKLFICDGDAGLKIFDATDIHSLDVNLIKHYGDIHAYDVIVDDCLVMLTGNDGLRQYHCSEFDGGITYLSTITFKSGQ